MERVLMFGEGDAKTVCRVWCAVFASSAHANHT